MKLVELRTLQPLLSYEPGDSWEVRPIKEDCQGSFGELELLSKEWDFESSSMKFGFKLSTLLPNKEVEFDFYFSKLHSCEDNTLYVVSDEPLELIREILGPKISDRVRVGDIYFTGEGEVVVTSLHKKEVESGTVTRVEYRGIKNDSMISGVLFGPSLGISKPSDWAYQRRNWSEEMERYKRNFLNLIYLTSDKPQQLC